MATIQERNEWTTEQLADEMGITRAKFEYLLTHYGEHFPFTKRGSQALPPRYFLITQLAPLVSKFKAARRGSDEAPSKILERALNPQAEHIALSPTRPGEAITLASLDSKLNLLLEEFNRLRQALGGA